MEYMLGVIHPYNVVNASPSLLFFCLPLLAIARIPRCLVHALISEALWEQEAAANELGCFDLSAKISYNVCTNLFKKKKKKKRTGLNTNRWNSRKTRPGLGQWLPCASAEAAYSNRSLWEDDVVQDALEEREGEGLHCAISPAPPYSPLFILLL